MSNVIAQVIHEIIMDKHYGVCKEIEVLKGKNKLKKSFKERLEQIKRNYYVFKAKNNY